MIFLCPQCQGCGRVSSECGCCHTQHVIACPMCGGIGFAPDNGTSSYLPQVFCAPINPNLRPAVIVEPGKGLR
jgi:hypothetical protein